MKEKLKNKRHIIVAVITSVIIFSVVFSALTLSKRPNKGKAETKPSVSDTANPEKGSEKDAGEITEEDTGKTAENNTENTTAEKNTEKVTENTAKNTTTEKNTQKPANTTTKKPVSTTAEDLVLVYFYSNGESYSKYVTQEEYDEIQKDEERWDLYRRYGGEEGYKAHLQEIANDKCPGCGKHDCPSMEYHTNRLGDVDSVRWVNSKCPNHGITKCSHCGKILTDSLNNEDVAKTEANPDKYCYGGCYVSFK